MEIKPYLEALKDPKPQARIDAVAALSGAGEAASGPLSGMAIDQNLPAHARACAVKALGGIGGPGAAKTLILALGDPDVVVKIPAAMALGKMKAEGAAGALAGLLGDESTLVRKYAADAICDIVQSCATAEKLLSLKGAITQGMPSSKAASEAASSVLAAISAKGQSLMSSDSNGLGSLSISAHKGGAGPKMQKIH